MFFLEYAVWKIMSRRRPNGKQWEPDELPSTMRPRRRVPRVRFNSVFREIEKKDRRRRYVPKPLWSQPKLPKVLMALRHKMGGRYLDIEDIVLSQRLTYDEHKRLRRKGVY